MFKQTTKMLALLFILASIALFIGCQDQHSVVTPDAGKNLSKENSITIPAGTTVVSAKLVLYQFIGNNKQNNIHRITAPWLEGTVTWSNFGSEYDPSVVGSFIPAPSKDDDTLHVDITSLVQGWADCSYDNNGLLIDQLSTDPSFIRSLFYSKENANPSLGERAPYLIVVLSTGATIEVAAIADAYIWEKPENINDNYGSSPFLNTGYLDGYEKQALVRFDILCTPPSGGCTLTPGYWKTHSQYGPAPYDPTWALLPNQEATPFFSSGKNYLEVLKTSPKGNAYYILSFQYIAAKLNFLNGADPSDAQAAFDLATGLFEDPANTPANIAKLKGSSLLRQQFVNLGAILDNYNNGLIGPGHCN